MKIKHNYHSHTIYCNHSSLTIGQTIEKAIELGLETIGFSEHMYFPGGRNMWRLADEKTMFEYFDEVELEKEKYGGTIRVLTGLECELRDQDGTNLIDHIKNLSSLNEVDYIIIGHHYYQNGRHTTRDKATKDMLIGYLADLKEAFEKLDVLYLAHPDVIIKGNGINLDTLWAFEEICKLAKKHDVILGINVNGFSFADYPSEDFFNIAAKYNCKAIVELDSHSDEQFKQKNIQRAFNIANKSGVELVDKII